MESFAEQTPATSEEEAVAFEVSWELAASADRIFDAWTIPPQLNKWWGPKNMDVQVVSVDLRPGGIFHYRMEGPHGVMYGRFVYREILRPTRLVFEVSFSDETAGIIRAPFSDAYPLITRSAITLEPLDESSTRMSLRGVPIESTAAERDAFKEMHASMRQGWGGTIEQLQDFLRTRA